MHVSPRVRWSPKFGNAPEDYEDASCLKQSNRERDVIRLAVADGATEASFSREWANLLVDAYCAGQFTKDVVSQLQQKWLVDVGAKSLPWYAEEKLQMGAYSSLMGLTLHAPIEGEVGKWEALAIGDSCLFQIQHDKLIVKWPLSKSALFNNSPILLSTKPECNDDQDKLTILGEWTPGDLFFLMTDALAQYYLQAVEQGDSPASVIPDFSLQPFPEWIADLRSSGQIRNDDVTLMRVCVA